MSNRRSILTVIGAFLIPLVGLTGEVYAQNGRITGVVTQSTSSQALAGAQIHLEGTSHGIVTNQSGRFLLNDIPPGTYTLQAVLIGHSARSMPVTVAAGQTLTLNIVLEQIAISMQEIVVTGMGGATAKAKTPFEIASVNARDIPVVGANAVSSIQGKVAGAMVVQGSGRPGSAPAVLLRGPKSINATGRSQEPLYIVDGVILGSDIVDIGGLDIDRVEIVKGAAAASLYGSRAANGVVQITTRRGRQMADQRIRYTVRSEFGQSDLPGKFDFLQHHAWKLTPDGTMFVDNNGTPCHFLDCSSPQLAGQTAGTATAGAWNTFATNPWPGGTYDQVGRFFEGGDWMETYVSASGRTGGTNFHASFSNTNEGGVMTSQRGFERKNFRLNLDQNIREDIQLSASAFYSRSDEDPRSGALFDLTRMLAGIDLTNCLGDDNKIIPGSNCLDNPERLLINTNPTNVESPNPLYESVARDFSRTRGRFLGAVTASYRPLDWLELSSNVSYDRFDNEDVLHTPKGYRTIAPSNTLNNGQLDYSDTRREALNANAKVTGRFSLGSNIRNTTTLQYLYEQRETESNSTNGFNYAVTGVPSLDNIDPTSLDASSSRTPIKMDGYFVITDFDIADKYVANFLVRNDGSSLFGEEERRQWYYAVRGAWRLGEEAWFPMQDALDELKLRYAFGTAGSSPSFAAQYETYSVSAGAVSPVNLGNKLLKPEFSKEHEAGFDAAFMQGRLGISVTYAHSDTDNQILPVPLPRYSGFGTQFQNAGSLQSKTWELSLDGVLLQNDNMRWSARVLFDRTRTQITKMNVPPFNYGVAGQGLGTVFYAREGEEYGTYYGVRYATSCDDLPSGMSCDGFTVNDDGWLVWVGGGGLASNAWGTSSDVTVRGSPVMWGTPFRGECSDRVTGNRTLSCPVGNSLPDYNMSFSSTFTYKNLTLYGLVDAVQGFDIYNQPLQWALFRRNIGMMDQTGVPENERKPIGYYDALYTVSGLLPSNVFVEDGSFVKLREVAVSYGVTSEQLSRLPGIGRTFSGATLRLSGRNLHTWTSYRGYDPETGSGGGNTGSAAIARVDGYQYPNFRTWRLGIELNF